MEIRLFLTKSRFLKWFQKGKFRSYYRVRFGQLVIEWRRIPDLSLQFEWTINEAIIAAKYLGLIEIERVKQ